MSSEHRKILKLLGRNFTEEAALGSAERFKVRDVEGDHYVQVSAVHMQFLKSSSLTKDVLQNLLRERQCSQRNVLVIPDDTFPSALQSQVQSVEYKTKHTGCLLMWNDINTESNSHFTAFGNGSLHFRNSKRPEAYQYNTSQKAKRSLKVAIRSKLSTRTALFTILLAFLMISVLLLLSFSNSTVPFGRTSSDWVRYSTPYTHGPRLQLRIDSSNSTAWSDANPRSLSDYRFRIDDQTMIPAYLMTPEEARYQNYFRKNYPQLYDVYRSRNHINATYLGAVESGKETILIDLKFHLSHCVLALRRYWNARETEKHVCPRDVDPGHIRHCLEALDEWAFPRPDQNTGDTFTATIGTLTWITQVCVEDR